MACEQSIRSRLFLSLKMVQKRYNRIEKGWYRLNFMVESTQARLEKTLLSTHRQLNTLAQSKDILGLSRLSLPEVEQMANQVAHALPAGNVPAMILNGLARLPGRHASQKLVRRDINMLFKGVELALDKAIYSTFFAGPAAVIWGYQNLLKLAGKNPEDAFPEGVWQFYVDYALREDTARHANETHGFDTVLTHHQISLPYADRLTAWVMAAIRCLHHYELYLENEWRERVYIHLLNEVTTGTSFAEKYKGLYRAWELQRPYRRSHTAKPYHSFADYRKELFDLYLKEATKNLPYELRTEWAKRISEAEETDLPAYKKQMSILAYLETGKYGEERIPLRLQDAHIGVIYKGYYYLIPACKPGSIHAPEMHEVRSQIMAILTHQPDTLPAHLTILASIKRSALFQVRETLNPVLKEGLNQLRRAPILLNFDARAADLPLAEIRQAERGCGDHALTVFDTGRSFVFDQSHIFFDGEWGAAFAEIMTNQALSMAVKLREMGMPQPSLTVPKLVHLPFEADETAALRRLPQVTPEASAENHQIRIRSVRVLRHILKKRNDFLALLTVNDLLLLYRAIHAVRYMPDPRIVAELQAMQQEAYTSAAATMALEALASDKYTNPTLLIPVNAMLRSPRDRVCPVSFEVPVTHLNFLELHDRLTASKEQTQEFQRDYFTALAAIAEILHRVKNVAAQGESSSAEVIKLLAHMPPSLQRWLDKVPNYFDVLNDLIKGREVFSNVGAVVPSSTLRRFTTAKDDNDKKTLCWGVITDAEGVVHLSLRDFRPHVSALKAVGRKDMADRLTQDYLDSYARGFKRFVRDLREITLGLPLTLNESAPSTDKSQAETLAQLLTRYAEQGDFMPIPEALRIGKAVAAVLDAAPTAHGNLSPAHIRLTKTGQIEVTGFGNTASKDKLADVKKLADIMYHLLTGIPQPIVAAHEVNPEINRRASQVLSRVYPSAKEFITALENTLREETHPALWLELPAPPANTAVSPVIFQRLTSPFRKTKTH